MRQIRVVLQGHGQLALERRICLRLRALLPPVALGALLAIVLSQLLGGTRAQVPSIARHPAGQRGLQSLPLSARAQISAAMAAHDPAYRITASPSGLQAHSAAQHLNAGFSRAGVSVSSGATRLALHLAAFGYGYTLRPMAAVIPSARANRVTYAHHGISEWYANGPLGLEQGFTVPRPPASHEPATLSLSLSLSGSARVALAADARTLTITHPGGPTLRYGGLLATDARGRTLHSFMRLQGNELRLLVDTRGGRYPLRIDPFWDFAQSRSKLTGGQGAGQFGESVALSSDGSTALVGAPYGNPFGNKIGAAYVFTGSTLQAKLTGAGEVGGARFGEIVALSSDGNTALIGGPGDNSNVGAAWVFTRSGSIWTQQGAKLTGSGGVGESYFGQSVALSSHGNTALIGGVNDNGGAGAAWVFTRSGSTWSRQGPKLIGSGESGGGHFGGSVALSSDGNTALIGGQGDNGEAGAAWVFARASSKWSQQGAKLTGSGESGKGAFGFRVALSSDGNTALIGGPFDSSLIGAAWVFTRSGSNWAQQGAKLTGSEELGSEVAFGAGVALSGDGNAALLGGPWDNSKKGAAWLFTRSGSTWNQQKLTGGEGIGESTFGAEVALASSGAPALIGGPFDNGQAGAAWMFAPTLSASIVVFKAKVVPVPKAGGGTYPKTGNCPGCGAALEEGYEFAGEGYGASPQDPKGAIPPISSVAFYLPAGTGVHPAEFATCTEDTLKNQGPSGCPSTSVASPLGNMLGEVTFGTERVPEEATFQAFFGPGGGLNFYVAGPEPVSLEVVPVGHYVAASPPYGQELITQWPAIETVPGAALLSVKKSSIKIGAGIQKNQLISYLTLPATCPEGGLPIETEVTFGGEPEFGIPAETVTATRKMPCFKPTIASLSPTGGSTAGGTTVTVAGTGFAVGTTGTRFKFGTAKGTGVKCTSSTSCTVVSPANAAGTVDVTATVSKATSLKTTSDRFTYS